MDKKSFATGLGTGLLIASTLSAIGYVRLLSDFRNNPPVSENKPAVMLEEDVGERLNAGNEGAVKDVNPDDAAEPDKLVIAEADTNADIASKLQQLGIVNKAADFEEYLDEKTLYVTMKPGEYEIPRGIAYDEILDTIINK